jgi:hypothetical protein
MRSEEPRILIKNGEDMIWPGYMLASALKWSINLLSQRGLTS